jgi:hypothetical protein
MWADLNLPNVPFVAGELGEFLYTRSKSPFAKTVNEQIRSLPAMCPQDLFQGESFPRGTHFRMHQQFRVAAYPLKRMANPLFPFTDRLSSVFSARVEKANS